MTAKTPPEPAAPANAAPADPAPVDPALKPAPPQPPAAWQRPVHLALRIAGFLVALGLTVLTAAFEAYLTPLYWGEHRVPVSAVAAVVVNLGLIWFTVEVTGRRLSVAAVAVVWIVMMVVASSRTSEGDLVLTDNNWVGIVTMLAGSLTFAVAGYRLVLAAFRPKI